MVGMSCLAREFSEWLVDTGLDRCIGSPVDAALSEGDVQWHMNYRHAVEFCSAKLEWIFASKSPAVLSVLSWMKDNISREMLLPPAENSLQEEEEEAHERELDYVNLRDQIVKLENQNKVLKQQIYRNKSQENELDAIRKDILIPEFLSLRSSSLSTVEELRNSIGSLQTLANEISSVQQSDFDRGVLNPFLETDDEFYQQLNAVNHSMFVKDEQDRESLSQSEYQTFQDEVNRLRNALGKAEVNNLLATVAVASSTTENHAIRNFRQWEGKNIMEAEKLIPELEKKVESLLKECSSLLPVVANLRLNTVISAKFAIEIRALESKSHYQERILEQLRYHYAQLLLIHILLLETFRCYQDCHDTFQNILQQYEIFIEYFNQIAEENMTEYVSFSNPERVSALNQKIEAVCQDINRLLKAEDKNSSEAMFIIEKLLPVSQEMETLLRDDSRTFQPNLTSEILAQKLDQVDELLDASSSRIRGVRDRMDSFS